MPLRGLIQALDALHFTMKPENSSYGNIAVLAALRASAGTNPQQAWEVEALKALGHSLAAVKKGCPKGAFLGLAHAGEIVGIKPDIGKTSGLNGKYALAALHLLRENHGLHVNPVALWNAVMKEAGISKKHNSQMHVVLALWNRGFLKVARV